MSQTLGRIRPTLSYSDFGKVDIIIEAVVENPKVKKAVFAEVEPLVRERYDHRVEYLDDLDPDTGRRPGRGRQNFVGMHFFNPVHMMPLVEVIRGKHRRTKPWRPRSSSPAGWARHPSS